HTLLPPPIDAFPTLRSSDLNRVTRKELFKFRVKLCSQRFIVRNDQRRPVQLLDHVRNRESFTGARDTEQCLMAIKRLNRLQELRDRKSTRLNSSHQISSDAV